MHNREMKTSWLFISIYIEILRRYRFGIFIFGIDYLHLWSSSVQSNVIKQKTLASNENINCHLFYVLLYSILCLTLHIMFDNNCLSYSQMFVTITCLIFIDHVMFRDPKISTTARDNVSCIQNWPRRDGWHVQLR